jgi:hypothetical protein
VLIAGVMLAAVASRALIPPGFMPASGRPFSLEICREGLTANILAQVESSHADSPELDSMDMGSMDMGSMRMEPTPANSMPRREEAPSHDDHRRGLPHHHGSPSQSEHCVFGTACNAGPIPQSPLPGDFSPAATARAVALAPLAGAIYLVHLPQPRAPPGRLS